jgi:hypothetical protein
VPLAGDFGKLEWATQCDRTGELRMSLTITIDSTDRGMFRAQVTDHPPLIIERLDLPGLVAELKRRLDSIVVTADGEIVLVHGQMGVDLDDAAARAEVEKTALRNEELDELIDRHPVPAEWGKEPGWTDNLDC